MKNKKIHQKAKKKMIERQRKKKKKKKPMCWKTMQRMGKRIENLQ